MRAIGVATVAGVLLALAVAARLAPAAESAPERPTYAVGQKWHLTDGVYELTNVEGVGEQRFYAFESGSNEIVLSRDLVPARVVRDRHTEWYMFPTPAIRWPLEVGKWGFASADLRTPEYRSGVKVHVTWKVAAVEDVQTPAGAFRAYRVDYRLEIPSTVPGSRHDVTGRYQWSFSTWYAPAARLIVKSDAYKMDPLSFQVASVERGAPSSDVAKAPTTAAPESRPPAATPAPSPPPAAPTPADAAPLTVTMRLPEDGARVNEPSSLVAAVVTSGKGVAKVDVTVNGVAQSMPQPDRPGAPSVAITVPITLQEGANAIIVSATGTDGTVRHELRTVTFERPPPVPVAPPVAQPAPPTAQDRWAVVIGVGTYDRSEIAPLRFPVADAEAVHQALIDYAGFKPDKIRLLTDQTPDKPTLRNIKSALGTFLVRSAKKEDLIVIFFAGHGAPEVDPRGVESDGLAKYLVPIDADPNDLYSTALPMDELQTIFDRIEAQRLVVFIDACYSGAAGGRTFASRRTRATRVDDLFLERLTRSQGRAIITAARANEVSIELPELGHGVFTHYLLQGLKGTADLDRDGIVTLQELYQYLEQQVARKSRAAGGNQHPVLKGELEGLLPLVKIGRAADR